MTDRQQLDAELVAIAKHLPGRWQLDPKYATHVWCAVLRDDAGHGLHFNMTAAKGRLTVSGMWPLDQHNVQHIPDQCQHISVARNRPPNKIAANLARRFLPWYFTAYADQVVRAYHLDAACRKRQQVAVELAALVEERAELRSDPASIHANGLTVEVNGPDSITIQLRYKSLKTAKAVLRALVKAGGLTE